MIFGEVVPVWGGVVCSHPLGRGAGGEPSGKGRLSTAVACQVDSIDQEAAHLVEDAAGGGVGQGVDGFGGGAQPAPAFFEGFL